MVPRHKPATTSPRRSVVLLAVLATALSACAGEVPQVDAGDPQLVQGRAIYSSNCVGCHGADGSGGTGSKLSDGFVVDAFPDPAAQFAVIADGKDRMPAFKGKLSDDEIDAVVRFTREGL